MAQFFEELYQTPAQTMSKEQKQDSLSVSMMRSDKETECNQYPVHPVV